MDSFNRRQFKVLTAFGLVNASLRIRMGLVVLISVFYCGIQAHAVAVHTGYIDDVDQERKTLITEVLIPPKPRADGPPLREVIFDPKLTTEFEQQYEVRFGRTHVEQNVDAPARFVEYEHTADILVTVEEDAHRRREFGEFMVKRLSEYHVDRYMRESPRARPLYELKERIGNANVSVRPGYEVKMHYSYSGNFVDLRLKNPYEIGNKLTLQMDPSTIGPSSIQEYVLSMYYPLNVVTRIESHIAVNDGVLSLIGHRSLAPGMSASLTASTNVHDHGATVRQQRLLVGLTWLQ